VAIQQIYSEEICRTGNATTAIVRHGCMMADVA
jgi:hypothetical protein